MKVLIVCSRNSGKIAPFILDQAESLKAIDVKIDFFTVSKKGLLGYLKSRKDLLLKIKEFQPDLIHAHYGLSGLLANLQRKVPVVTTYHGSDINNDRVYPYSRICIFLSAFNIFVSDKNRLKAKQKKKQAVIPCGVDIELFKPTSKQKARQILNYKQEDKLILFAGAFDNKVKNAALAKAAVLHIQNANLIELKGYTREEVALLMNVVDVALMTSFTEGSPQFIKEAMACNCPIVSVDVGDVKDVIENITGCYLVNYDENDIAEKLQKVFDFSGRTTGRQRIIELSLDTETVAKRILEIYNQIIRK